MSSLDNGSNGTYIVDNNDPAVNKSDRERLIDQHNVLKSRMGLHTSMYVPKEGDRILDAACGPSPWIVDMSEKYPYTDIYGFDSNKDAIKDAEKNTAHQENVSLDVLDITKPLPYITETFDFIHARFIGGVVPGESCWTQFIAECVRLLKPGGIIQLVEFETSLIVDAPALHEVFDMVLEYLWKRSQAFSRHAVAISPMMKKLLVQAHFSDIQLQPYYFDWSAGAELHDGVAENMLVATRILSKRLMEIRSMPEADFEQLYARAVVETQSPDFYATWLVATGCGRKKK
jgi:ubiquinone/menaquinone biosynthesis C-methylase UbiE